MPLLSFSEGTLVTKSVSIKPTFWRLTGPGLGLCAAAIADMTKTLAATATFAVTGI
jgi:hypothetical protein